MCIVLAQSKRGATCRTSSSLELAGVGGEMHLSVGVHGWGGSREDAIASCGRSHESYSRNTAVIGETVEKSENWNNKD